MLTFYAILSWQYKLAELYNNKLTQIVITNNKNQHMLYTQTFKKQLEEIQFMLKMNKLALSVVTALALTTSATAATLAANANINNDNNPVQANPLAPGIIIKYKSANKSQSIRQSEVRATEMGKAYGIDIRFKRKMSGNAEVLTIDQVSSKSMGKNKLKDIVAQLNQRTDVEYAEIDAWMIPYATPNDTAYNTQWHYHESAGGMRLPAAWDTTTGSSSVTVAVLDTGYRPHSDLAGNVIGQYDMISSSSVGNDGNGRDSNAQDPGDWTTADQCGTGSSASDSSWHGTHVAGTVAAVSNNNNDVAGVAWNVGLVPVRVLGTCGGSLSDIADGIRWAAGLTVSGVPTNNNPAQVINMSLGSSQPSSCSSTYQNAINAAYNAGTTIVVAAGNDNSSSGYPPANCNNVISVAATNRNGGRAYYSNFGSTIDVAAPGGDGCNPTGEGEPTSLSDCEGNVWNESNMIQSTHNSGTSTPASDTIGALQGTSMAAPHVAGLAALMYSVDLNATPAEIESTMKSTARSFPNVSSHQCTTSNCGAGIVDANAAVDAMGGTTPPPSNNTLTNGVAETGLSGSTGNGVNYTMDVPSGASNLAFNLTSMTGDGDLYVKFGSAPTTSSYDCRSWNGAGQDEVCNISSAQVGTYHVLVHAYAAYSGASLLGSYTTVSPNIDPTAAFTSNCTDLSCSFDGTGSSDSDGSVASYSWSFGGSGSTASNTYGSAGTYNVTLTVTDNDGATDSVTHSVTVTEPPVANNELTNGVAKTGLSGSKNSQQEFTLAVPAGASGLSFVMSGGSGDADLYVKFGSAPTTSSYDCRSWTSGNSETCDISNAQTGTYYVMINAYSTFSGASLTGSFTAGGGSQQAVFTSETNVNIPDNNPTGATSNISVNRTGNAGNVKITYSIIHTYQGDLTVNLIAPNGGTATLRSPSGGGTNNINESKTIDASSSDANGTWGLQVIDGAGADTGYIDSWSIEFL